MKITEGFKGAMKVWGLCLCLLVGAGEARAVGSDGEEDDLDRDLALYSSSEVEELSDEDLDREAKDLLREHEEQERLTKAEEADRLRLAEEERLRLAEEERLRLEEADRLRLEEADRQRLAEEARKTEEYSRAFFSSGPSKDILNRGSTSFALNAHKERERKRLGEEENERVERQKKQHEEAKAEALEAERRREIESVFHKSKKKEADLQRQEYTKRYSSGSLVSKGSSHLNLTVNQLSGKLRSLLDGSVDHMEIRIASDELALLKNRLLGSNPEVIETFKLLNPRFTDNRDGTATVYLDGVNIQRSNAFGGLAGGSGQPRLTLIEEPQGGELPYVAPGELAHEDAVRQIAQFLTPVMTEKERQQREAAELERRRLAEEERLFREQAEAEAEDEEFIAGLFDIPLTPEHLKQLLAGFIKREVPIVADSIVQAGGKDFYDQVRDVFFQDTDGSMELLDAYITWNLDQYGRWGYSLGFRGNAVDQWIQGNAEPRGFLETGIRLERLFNGLKFCAEKLVRDKPENVNRAWLDEAMKKCRQTLPGPQANLPQAMQGILLQKQLREWEQAEADRQRDFQQVEADRLAREAALKAQREADLKAQREAADEAARRAQQNQNQQWYFPPSNQDNQNNQKKTQPKTSTPKKSKTQTQALDNRARPLFSPFAQVSREWEQEYVREVPRLSVVQVATPAPTQIAAIQAVVSQQAFRELTKETQAVIKKIKYTPLAKPASRPSLALAKQADPNAAFAKVAIVHLTAKLKGLTGAAKIKMQRDIDRIKAALARREAIKAGRFVPRVRTNTGSKAPLLRSGAAKAAPAAKVPTGRTVRAAA